MGISFCSRLPRKRKQVQENRSSIKMSRGVGIASLVVAMAILSLSAAASDEQGERRSIFDCYEVWSRCSGWSSFLTGYAWLTCDDRCKELGKSGGNCVPVPSNCPLSSDALQ